MRVKSFVLQCLVDSCALFAVTVVCFSITVVDSFAKNRGVVG